MFDHVTIRVSDRRASEAAYRTVLAELGIDVLAADESFVEWDDFSLLEASVERAATTGLHIGFVAPSRAHVDAFWHAGRAGGLRDAGAPGERPDYKPDYYGAFLLDPDGNSIEAVHHGSVDTEATIDHLWLRTSDLAASRAFYGQVAPLAGLRIRDLSAEHVQVLGAAGSFSIVPGAPTRGLHMAFAADTNAAVDEFHRLLVAAGYRDDGSPGERPIYHAGSYGAFVLDPDSSCRTLIVAAGVCLLTFRLCCVRIPRVSLALTRVLASAVVVCVATVCSAAATAATGSDGPLDALQRESSVPLQLGLDSSTGSIRKVRGRFASIAGPEQAARGFLARHAGALGLPPGLAGAARVQRFDDVGGSVLRFAQELEGIPVLDGSVLVGFDRGGGIIYVDNRSVADVGVPASPVVSRERAVEAAAAALGVAVPVGSNVRLVVVRGGKGWPGHYLAWEVGVASAWPLAAWTVFVDSQTGAVVRRLDLMKRAGPACVAANPATDNQAALVFAKNPIDYFDDTLLRESSNVDAALVGCKLNNLTSSTALSGLYANTSLTFAPRAGPPYVSVRSVNERAVDEATAYYHVNRSKEYLTQLGFPAVMNFSISVDAADALGANNATYLSSNKTISMGIGTGPFVDSAQDPDVIYHELMHAIQDDQVPGFGQTSEGGGIGEGSADYWAAALTDDAAATALGPACWAAWFASGPFPYVGTLGSGCVRRVDGVKQYPADVTFEVHADGEIFSPALWALRQAIGGEDTDRLVIKSHTFLQPDSNFIDAADALLSADQALYGGSHAAVINDVMKARGLPRTASPAPSTGLTASEAFSCETAHPYAGLAYKECRFTKANATRLRVHFANFETEQDYDPVHVSDDDYQEVQTLSGTPFGPTSGGYSAAVNGDTIVLRFKADPSISMQGFAIDRVEYALGCTRSAGYWKNNRNDPAWTKLGGPTTPFFLSGSSYGTVLATTGSRNAYYVLARQYISARLNQLSGAPFADAATSFATATAILQQYTPAQISSLSPKSALRAQLLSLARTLEAYNTGVTGPGVCAAN